MGIVLRLKIQLTRLGVKTIGRTSQGIRMVSRIGLTSGIMLDYIYRNQPQGKFLIGKWLDRIYLSHPAWEDVRIRKKNLQEYLTEAVHLQRNLQRKPVILDVAAGAARYILDTVSREDMQDVTAVCRDLDNDALTLGGSNASQMGISSVKFETGDAFSADSLAEVDPVPNIIVSSGFYDWINQDAQVRESMSLIFDVLPEGGCFLFTNQSKHVSLEYTQQVFSDFKGNPLRMTLRPAQAVNKWVEDIGYKIFKTTGDKEYNYSVTLAVKPQ
jgi:SAM-dependent methyltransferase